MHESINTNGYLQFPSVQFLPTAFEMDKSSLVTGHDVRRAARNKTWTGPTAGLAPGHLQANLIVLPSRYATDFRNLCARNPVPCPLIAESTSVGRWDSVKSCVPSADVLVKSELDLRQDVGRYMVYRDSELMEFGVEDLVEDWTEDHVAFLIGCSFSFETALTAAGLAPPHVLFQTNVPMYRTQSS